LIHKMDTVRTQFVIIYSLLFIVATWPPSSLECVVDLL
jgi:hypothetical protein